MFGKKKKKGKKSKQFKSPLLKRGKAVRRGNTPQTQFNDIYSDLEYIHKEKKRVETARKKADVDVGIKAAKHVGESLSYVAEKLKRRREYQTPYGEQSNPGKVERAAKYAGTILTVAGMASQYYNDLSEEGKEYVKSYLF